MIRQVFKEKQGEFAADGFRLRGVEVTRLEGLTDGVFALAMTLTIVSVEVPNSFDQLVTVLMGLPAFAASFAIMMWFWTTHYTYSRRYGLSDPLTIALNSVLLFVVLFYVYPMKFLFTVVMLNMMKAGQLSQAAHMTEAQARQLYVLYGVGFGSIALVFLVMHAHAISKRAALALNELEVVLTRERIVRHLFHAVIAATSIGLALIVPAKWLSLPGMAYFSMAVFETVIGTMYGRKAGRLMRREAAGSAESGSISAEA